MDPLSPGSVRRGLRMQLRLLRQDADVPARPRPEQQLVGGRAERPTALAGRRFEPRPVADGDLPAREPEDARWNRYTTVLTLARRGPSSSESKLVRERERDPL